MYLQNSSKHQQITSRSQLMYKILSSSITLWSKIAKNCKILQKKRINFSTIHRPTGGYHQRNFVFCLWLIITQLLCLHYLLGVSSLQIGSHRMENPLYSPDIIEIASLERLTLWWSEITQSKRPLASVMHDFHGLKKMTFHCLTDTSYFSLAVTEIIQFFP